MKSIGRNSLLAVPVVGLAIAVAVLALPADASSPPSDPHKTVVVTAEEARAIIERVLPACDRDFTYEGTKDRPGVRVHVFAGPDVYAAVDVSDGHIAILSLQVPHASGAPTITAAQAERIATEYLRTMGSPIGGLVADVSAATGSGTPGYTVTFRRTAGGAYLPDYRVVQVDGTTGEVFSLVDVRRPVDPPPAPRVTAAQAQAAAAASVGGGSTSTPYLIVWFDPLGRQLLIWMVPVSGAPGGPGAVIAIDAETGEPVILNP